MAAKRKIIFTAPVWLYSGKAAWHFATVPVKISKMIFEKYSPSAKAWGTLGVIVIIGKTTWKTSMFPDKKTRCYLLPLKRQIRKREKIIAGNEIKIKIEIL